MKCPFTNKNVPLENLVDGQVQYDALCKRRTKTPPCQGAACLGSLMNQKPHSGQYTIEEVTQKARDFFKEYYEYVRDTVSQEVDAQVEKRMEEVEASLQMTGTYSLNTEELEFGARTAWRNAARCPARVQWKNLTLVDRREVDTAEEMFHDICNHIKASTNGGKIKPTITVFRGRTPGKGDPRVWNGLMMSYAGYLQSDGSVIGDRGSTEFTEFCQSLGWKGPGTQFDILPIVLSGADGIPHWFSVPEELVIRVPIQHPNNTAINDLALQWIGLPMVSGMMYEVGGLQFPAAPFSGWYTGAEIATRDFLDIQRYNLLEPLGQAMGLDITNNSSLWKDKVSLELNVAVLISYQKAGVSIVDHHSQSDQFISHMQTEYKERGGCPADWVWLVPPQGGSLTTVYHQEMANYHLSPSYEYQDKLWKTYGRVSNSKKTLRSVAWILVLFNSLYRRMLRKRPRVTIFYGTETGTSKKFSQQAMQLFSTTFDCRLLPLSSTETFPAIQESSLSLFITSTFGNGEAPTMAAQFDRKLGDLVDRQAQESCSVEYTRSLSTPECMSTADYVSEDWLKNLRYAVFGLGSSAYPKFAGFGKLLDTRLYHLGGTRLVPVGVGDELGNQEGAFKAWVKGAFLSACEDLQIQTSVQVMAEAITKMGKTAVVDTAQYRWRVMETNKKKLNTALAEVHQVNVVDMTLVRREDLHQEPDQSRTLLVGLAPECMKPIYEPGDHLGVCPSNTEDAVSLLKSRMLTPPPPRAPLALERKEDEKGPWLPVEGYPKGLYFDELLTYCVDLRSAPTQGLLKSLSNAAKDEKEAQTLLQLSRDFSAYQAWREEHDAGIVETLDLFPSIRCPCSASLLGQLPTIKPRRYSIASTAAFEGTEVNLVVGVVDFIHKSGKRRLGLSTGILSTATLGTKIPGFLRSETNFRLPEDPEKPVMMIAAGSGLAPFRGFWMKRGEQLSSEKNPGKSVLYFGCRRRSMDLLRQETDRLSAAGLPIERHLALSQEPGVKKQYVQDLVMDDFMMVYKMIKDGGHIYVCGQVKMAQAVQEILIKILIRFLHQSQEDAEKTILKMKYDGKYQEDIFG